MNQNESLGGHGGTCFNPYCTPYIAQLDSRWLTDLTASFDPTSVQPGNVKAGDGSDICSNHLHRVRNRQPPSRASFASLATVRNLRKSRLLGSDSPPYARVAFFSHSCLLDDSVCGLSNQEPKIQPHFVVGWYTTRIIFTPVSSASPSSK